MYGLKTPAAEVAQAPLIVLRRGSLRSAEEITGHKYETISVWLKRAATHAEALTGVLASDLHLGQVQIDEFWSFVQMPNAMPAFDALVGEAALRSQLPSGSSSVAAASWGRGASLSAAVSCDGSGANGSSLVVSRIKEGY